MANYAGELLRITVTAEDFRKESLTEDDVQFIKVSIFDSTGTEILTEHTMSWQEEELLWYYLWTTTTDALTTVADGGTPLDPGSYRAKCRMLDLDDHESWEYLRIRLQRNPV